MRLPRRVTTGLIFCMVSILAQGAAGMTSQVVLFTGFGAGTDAGMDFLHEDLSTSGIPNYEGRVFEWTQQQEAFDWIEEFEGQRSTLVLIGHSYGGARTLQLANDDLMPAGVDVDLTIQVDSVAFSGSEWNDQLPTNVEVGINYYQIATGFDFFQGEQNVQGATNINAEELFADPSITHTSLDNDPRLHAQIELDILDNLNLENADFNVDLDVDGADFLAWQIGYGMTGTAVPGDGDANGDTGVDEQDLLIWRQQFGSAPSSAAIAIPEPTAGVLAGILLAAACAHWGSRVAVGIQYR